MLRGCVWSKNLKNEQNMARVGPQRRRKKKVYIEFNLRSLTRCTAESDETVWKDLAVLQLKYAVYVSHD